MRSRILIIAAALVALALIGADYLRRARPSIAAVAIEKGLTADHRLSEADIEDDTARQDDYWAGQAFALANAIHLPARCPPENEAFRRGCEDVARAPASSSPPCHASVLRAHPLGGGRA